MSDEHPLNTEEFRPKTSAAAVAEQSQRFITEDENQRKICIIKWKENNVEISRSPTIRWNLFET